MTVKQVLQKTKELLENPPKEWGNRVDFETAVQRAAQDTESDRSVANAAIRELQATGRLPKRSASKQELIEIITDVIPTL